jgi:hypothetical protein
MGRAIRYEPAIETSSAESETVMSDDAPPSSNAKRKKKKSNSGPDTLADAISGFWMN